MGHSKRLKKQSQNLKRTRWRSLARKSFDLLEFADVASGSLWEFRGLQSHHQTIKNKPWHHSKAAWDGDVEKRDSSFGDQHWRHSLSALSPRAQARKREAYATRRAGLLERNSFRYTHRWW
jgi:hypothetical protein